MLCVYSVLNSNSYLPFSKFFQGLGIYAYSIFLFHRNYFKGLEKIGILEKYDVSPGSMLICIILLPVFLASVAYFEEIVNGMVNRNFNLKDITRKYYSNIFRKKYGKH
jgi:peptidoglycan/LPS O-acetylase OafA/YrhL